MTFYRKTYFCGPKRLGTNIVYDNATRNNIDRVSDIVSFVNRLTPLRQCKNGDFKGTCLLCQAKLGPTDNTTHFRINIKNKYFKCFRCGKGGKLTGFVKLYYQVAYDRAVQIIWQSLPKEQQFPLTIIAHKDNRKNVLRKLQQLKIDIKKLEENAVQTRRAIKDEDLPF